MRFLRRIVDAIEIIVTAPFRAIRAYCPPDGPAEATSGSEEGAGGAGRARRRSRGKESTSRSPGPAPLGDDGGRELGSEVGGQRFYVRRKRDLWARHAAAPNASWRGEEPAARGRLAALRLVLTRRVGLVLLEHKDLDV